VLKFLRANDIRKDGRFFDLIVDSAEGSLDESPAVFFLFLGILFGLMSIGHVRPSQTHRQFFTALGYRVAVLSRNSFMFFRVCCL